MARSVMLDQWMAEMKQLSAATAKAEATRKVAIASAQQVRARVSGVLRFGATEPGEAPVAVIGSKAAAACLCVSRDFTRLLLV